MFSGKTIFISPLDWGLGHATRCVPLIQRLAQHNTVIIGTTPVNHHFFERHFPSLQKINLPSYNIRYSVVLPQWLKILGQWPRITAVIRKEKISLEKIIKAHGVNVVISDNRFGLHHKSATCIFITHQVRLQVPFFSFLANYLNRNYIHRFDELWVPDFEDTGRRLAGRLSNSKAVKIPVRYILPQSRLPEFRKDIVPSGKTDALILLSGPEPQRSLLEAMLYDKFKTSSKKIVLVRGARDLPLLPPSAIEVIEFADGKALCQLIVNAETVICRSGYSTLMDLFLLEKKKLVLIPTPGQTEQEYLARYWEKKFAAVRVMQHHIKTQNF